MNRLGYFLRRLLLSIPVILFATTITFIALRMGPIDPASAIIGEETDAATYREIERSLGLHKPLWEQYIDYMVGLFTLDLGRSWVLHPGTDANALILSYGPRTLYLGFWAVLISLFVGIPLGFYAGLNPNTWGDYAVSFGGIVWRAMPNFWLAVIVVTILTSSQRYMFGFDYQSWIIEAPIVTAPPMGDFFTLEGFLIATKMTLPAAIVLGSASMGSEMRIGRTAVLETVNSNYVETAKAKGVSGRLLVWKHIFRNALIPLIPVITYEAFLLIGGSVLVETVFGHNGLGYLFFQACIQGDLPLVGSLMFIFILLLVFINILQDLLYTLVDPRVGYEGGAA